MRYQESKSLPESYIKPSECCFTLKWFHAIIILVKNFDGMKLFLIGGMEDLNFNYCYKITYESGETYDRRRNELSVEISKEDYKKIITGVLQERPIDQIEGIEYSCAVTPQVRQTGNRLSGLAGTAYASLLA